MEARSTQRESQRTLQHSNSGASDSEDGFSYRSLNSLPYGGQPWKAMFKDPLFLLGAFQFIIAIVDTWVTLLFARD